MHDGIAIKKVAPYPFNVQIVKAEGQPPFNAQIVKLTPIGFLMRFDRSHHFKVGDEHLAVFVLPVVNFEVKTSVRVIKIYLGQELLLGNRKQNIYTVELHFKLLDGNDRISIEDYLKKSGQYK
ncbi:MAG: hypothetical protein LW875_01395 [Proteobacteria bacterium]|jgi:hypothetical protein|nr:hypothetical protein [Pseudomonadota bacterium]